jgi:hypothetical protein
VHGRHRILSLSRTPVDREVFQRRNVFLLDFHGPIYTLNCMSDKAQLPLFRRRGIPGVGRRPGANPRVRHRSRADFRGRFPGHVTLKVREGLRSLRDGRIVRALQGTLREACDQDHFRVVEFSIQGDHLPLLVQAADRKALGRGMKSITAGSRAR